MTYTLPLVQKNGGRTATPLNKRCDTLTGRLREEKDDYKGTLSSPRLYAEDQYCLQQGCRSKSQLFFDKTCLQQGSRPEISQVAALHQIFLVIDAVGEQALQ